MLAYYDVDRQEAMPLLAESIVPNDDATQWTITLPEGAEFGNGDPLDAAALVAHFDRHLGPESTSRVRANAVQVIQSWEAVDDRSVTVTLHYSYPRFANLLAGDVGMVQNVALINARGEAFGTDPAGAGAGPYEIVEYSPPERIVFEAKDDWWGGPVCIERVVYEFIPDLRANYDAFRKGEIDAVLLARDPAVINEARAEYPHAVSQMFNGAFFTMPNAGLGHTADVRVRQAMAYAIDAEVINQRAWGGEGWSGKGVVLEDSITLDATDGLPYDPERARQLLDEYKAETGWDGSIRGIAANTPASNQEAALAIAAMLNAVGFNVDANVDLPINDLITQVAIDKNFELVLSWGIIQPEPALWNGLRTWASDNPANQNGFSSPAFDAAMVALRSADSQAEYQAALEQTQQVVNDEVPFIAYGGDLSTFVYDPAIKGARLHMNETLILDTAYLES